MAPVSLSIQIDLDTDVTKGIVSTTMSGFSTVAMISFVVVSDAVERSDF